jgi:YD repeat-containing protein
MVYDLAGRQLSIRNEVGYATTTSYDLNGRVVSTIDGTSRVKTLSYDDARTISRPSMLAGRF